MTQLPAFQRGVHEASGLKTCEYSADAVVFQLDGLVCPVKGLRMTGPGLGGNWVFWVSRLWGPLRQTLDRGEESEFLRIWIPNGTDAIVKPGKDGFTFGDDDEVQEFAEPTWSLLAVFRVVATKEIGYAVNVPPHVRAYEKVLFEVGELVGGKLVQAAKEESGRG